MPLTPEQIAHKQALGIPVHLEESDHDYRADGYCNCGEQRPRTARSRRYFASPQARIDGGRRGRINLDVQERNMGGDRA